MVYCSLVRLYQTLHGMFHPTSSHIEIGENLYIYTLLFRRDSISRGFNFAISIGKYEKREWNFVIQAFLTSFYFQTVSAY